MLQSKHWESLLRLIRCWMKKQKSWTTMRSNHLRLLIRSRL